MKSLSEKIVQGILLELHHVVSEKKWGKLIEFVESELAAKQSVQAGRLLTPLALDACPYCVGKGKEPANDALVRCRFCDGTGKRQ